VSIAFSFTALDFLSTVGAALSASLAAGVAAKVFYGMRAREPETLEARITKLTTALKESSSLVTEVEEEIESRQKLVAELQKDAENYERLISLNKEQVDAVAQLLQGELRKEGNKSFWKAVAVNSLFFILGAGFSWWLSSPGA
jgi:TolA-binding protein